MCESSERWLLLRPLEASESGEEAIQKGSPWRPALSLSVRRRQNPAEEAGWSGAAELAAAVLLEGSAGAGAGAGPRLTEAGGWLALGGSLVSGPGRGGGGGKGEAPGERGEAP